MRSPSTGGVAMRRSSPASEFRALSRSRFGLRVHLLRPSETRLVDRVIGNCGVIENEG